jgi:iron complex outermembrane receptor protein
MLNSDLRAYARGMFVVFLTLAAPAIPAASLTTAPEEPSDEARAQDGQNGQEEASPAAENRFQEEITVVGKENPSLTLPGPAAAAREIEQIPGGADLVDAESYKRGRASTLQDALAFSPGVFVQPRFGSEEARLSIRGSGLQRTFHGRGLKLLQDGVPLNLADGGFDFQAVEPLSARYIEVFRGSNALQYGSSTLGGAINYLSNNGYEADPAQVRVESGAFGYLRGQASAGRAAGRRDYYATLTHSSQGGFREHSQQSTQRFFGNLGHRASEDRETRFYFAAVHTDSELPGSLTKAQLEADPSQAAPRNVQLDQKRDFDLFRLANRTSFRFGAESRLDLGTFWSYKHLDHPIFQVLDQRSHDFGADLRYQKDTPWRGRQNRLVLGISPMLGLLQDDRFQNVNGQRGARTAQGETTSVNVDLYAEDRLTLSPGLTLSAGAQLSYAGRSFADEFLIEGDQTDSQDFQGFSPKLGLLYDISPRVAVFCNVSRSFEPPSFGELVNVGGNHLVQLDAQTATSAEIGSRGTAGRVSWDFVLYHARLDGELLSLNDAVGNPLGTLNADRTFHSGLEAGLEIRLARRLLLRQVYNWSRFVFDGDPAYGDNQLAGLPEHFYRAELLYERSGFYGGANVEWVPDRYPVDHANSLFADPYTILGLKVGYRAADGLGGFIEGKNLTDEAYAATTGVVADARGRDSAQFLPGDGASFFAGLEYRW